MVTDQMDLSASSHRNYLAEVHQFCEHDTIRILEARVVRISATFGSVDERHSSINILDVPNVVLQGFFSV